MQVIAEVPNPDGQLRGGLFVKGLVRSRARHALQVPQTALRQWEAERRVGEVLVVVDGIAQPRRVVTGVVVDGAVEVVEGLAAGEVVVTRGGFAVQAGDRVTVVDQATRPAA